MAARSTCTCALTFMGFPIHIAVYTTVKDRKSASFKMLDPVHKQPVHQVLLDCKGTTVERAATLKGVVCKDSYVALPEAALEMIGNVGRSVVVEIERFAPVASLPLELALENYKIVPDEHVPGSEQPVAILWNGLRASQRAAVIPNWSPKANSRPSTFVIRATGDGLSGVLLPFGSELKADLPTWVPVADERAASLSSQIMQRDYCTEDFDISVYIDGYAQRRQAAIDLALSGKPIDVPKPAEAAAPAVPDLMAALEASLAAVAPAAEPALEKVAA